MCLSEYKIIKKVSLCVYLSICYTYMFRCSQASEKTEISMLKLQALWVAAGNWTQVPAIAVKCFNHWAFSPVPK